MQIMLVIYVAKFFFFYLGDIVFNKIVTLFTAQTVVFKVTSILGHLRDNIFAYTTFIFFLPDHVEVALNVDFLKFLFS